MNEQLTENEIKKLLEQLNYASEEDIMKQQLFFIQTETIRQQRINDERIVNVLLEIAANNPSSSARKEARKTLRHLGVTLPPINPKFAKEVKARDAAIGFFGWIIFSNLFFTLSAFVLLFGIQLMSIDQFVTFSFVALWLAAVITPLILIVKQRVWVSTGIAAAAIINIGIWVVLGSFEPGIILPFPISVLLLQQ